MLTDLEQTEKKEWLVNLRSGKYKQATGALYDEETNGYCCLGVLQHSKDGEVDCAYNKEADRVVPGGVPNTLFYKYPQFKWVYNNAVNLVTMNDGGNSFTEIADWIENQWV